MIKSLQRIGNSRGIVIDKPILDLLNINEAEQAFEVTHQRGGLFLKPVNMKTLYKHIAKKHRKSLDKLAK